MRPLELSLRLPGLTLAERPDLFCALVDFGQGDIVSSRSAVLGSRPGWLVNDGPTARKLLGSALAVKGRNEASHQAVGGYGASVRHDFRARRRSVVHALTLSARQADRIGEHLAIAFAGRSPGTDPGPEEFGQALLCHLAGLPAGTLPDALPARVAAEIQQAAEEPAHPGESEARAELLGLVADRLATGAPPVFMRVLVSAGWSVTEIADELSALLFAGWESVAAAVTSGRTLGLRYTGDRRMVSELLRLYPPSWVIARRLLAPVDGVPGRTGDLVVVSPWLLHRDRRGWVAPETFDSGRFTGSWPRAWYLPFGAGERRCPAEAYARVQIERALRLAGKMPTGRTAKVRLLRGRSAALVTEGGTTADEPTRRRA